VTSRTRTYRLQRDHDRKPTAPACLCSLTRPLGSSEAVGGSRPLRLAGWRAWRGLAAVCLPILALIGCQLCGSTRRGLYLETTAPMHQRWETPYEPAADQPLLAGSSTASMVIASLAASVSKPSAHMPALPPVPSCTWISPQSVDIVNDYAVSGLKLKLGQNHSRTARPLTLPSPSINASASS